MSTVFFTGQIFLCKSPSSHAFCGDAGMPDLVTPVKIEARRMYISWRDATVTHPVHRNEGAAHYGTINVAHIPSPYSRSPKQKFLLYAVKLPRAPSDLIPR